MTLILNGLLLGCKDLGGPTNVQSQKRWSQKISVTAMDITINLEFHGDGFLPLVWFEPGY